MEKVKKIIVKRTDGVYVNVHLEPVKSIRAALRFSTIDEYEQFIHGYYGPPDPSKYKPQTIQVTYEEVDEDV